MGCWQVLVLGLLVDCHCPPSGFNARPDAFGHYGNAGKYMDNAHIGA
jgi:hypothetical protein